MQNVKKIKKSKKAIIKLYSLYQSKLYSVKCPHCHTELVGGLEPNVLMFICTHCGNTIDLRDKNGKRAYEETTAKPEIQFCECYLEHEFIKRDTCVHCGKLKSNNYVR